MAVAYRGQRSSGVAWPFLLMRTQWHPVRRLSSHIAGASRVTAFIVHRARGMTASDIAEGHCRTEIDAARRVETAHYAVHIGSHRVEARNRRADLINRLRRPR